MPLHELYALSLTIGTCLDPQTVCKDFVGALLRCLGLGYAGVWVTPAGRGQSPDPGFELVFETPPIPGTSYTPPPSPPTSLGSDAGCIFFDASSRSTADLGQNEGRCATGAWLPLGELGWLEIQRSAPPIAEVELSALLPLVARFAVALQAAFWTARRTQSEPAACSGEARFVAMAEQSADWIWILDTRGRHTYSNGRTREILGYSRDEFLAADPLDLVHPDDHAVFLATFQGAVARRTGWQNVLLRWRHRDGSYRVLESNASAVLDEGGQLVEFQGVDRDVTDRASREQASHRLASIVEHSLDFIGIADVEGQIQVVNPAGRALVGLEPLEDIKSKRIPDFVHESSRGLFADQVTPVVLQTGHWQGELCFRNLRTGAAVSVLSDVFRIDGSDGRPLHMATVSRDIRERKRSEELLDRHNRLLRSVAAGSAILVTERSEQGMMSAICRILVEQGRYRMAWIGRVGPEGARVLPVASAGARTDYLATVDIRCDDSPLAAGPTGTAIRTNRSVVIDDLAADARFAPWREVALSAAFLSSAATPLRVQGQVIGALNVYSGELAAFRPDELVLLEKLAADLGSALERQRAETALRDSEARFRLLLDSTAEAIYGVDTNGTCIFVNPACLRMLGYAREEDLIGRNLHALIHHTTADGRPYPKEQCPVRCSTLQGKPTHVADEVQWRADGSCFPVEYWSHPMYRDGELLGAVVTFLDITERRRAEQALRASEARYRLISSVTSDMLFSCVRGDGGMLAIDWAAGSVEPIFGCSIEELKAQDCWRCFVHPADLHIFDRHIGALRPGQSSQCELRIVHRDGSTRYVHTASRVLPEENGHRLYGACQDITERKEAGERIAYLAHHDVLTGLPNRVLLRDRFAHALALADRHGSHLAILFLDLDNFKMVNDTLGHAAGDRLLQTVAAQLRDCVRDTDTVSRQGGDEFVVLLDDVHHTTTVERVAGKILERLATPLDIDGNVLTTSASIGICVHPEDGRDFDLLLQKADTAMYAAKEAGRNGYRFFNGEMNRHAQEHLRLQHRLRQALAGGELTLHYQPLIELAGGRVVGAEALLRWSDPELGDVSPARFIPVAEDCGLIVPIGAWVLEEACRQAQRWGDAGLGNLTIAVNLSSLQLRRGDFVESIAGVLDRSGLAPQRLELELTESVLLHDSKLTLETLGRLKAMGVRLAIDDFGTGYSSLSYLRRIPIDTLKIDRSFVRNVATDPDSAAIVHAILQLARSLRLGAVAEGVESTDQVEFLRAAGCAQAQGYLFSPALSAVELEAWVRGRGRT